MSKTKVRFQLFSDDELDLSDEDNNSIDNNDRENYESEEEYNDNKEVLEKFKKIKSTLKLVNPERYNLIPENTRVCYQTTSGSIVLNKYFKLFDSKNNVEFIKFGFSINNRRNYDVHVRKIQKIYTYGIVQGGIPSSKNNSSIIKNAEDIESENNLKNTILLKKSEWDSIQPGTTISYKKVRDSQFVFRVKFNCIVNGKKGKLFSCTNHTGFNYVIKPVNIEEIYRHILPIDITIIQLLESVENIKKRMNRLEKVIHSLSSGK